MLTYIARNSSDGFEARIEPRYSGKDARVESRKPIRSFFDLEVYQNTYKASIEVIVDILPKLPKEEKYDLVNQLRRSAKAIPRLIAEGYSKKHQRHGFQKYIDDAMAESNETIVSLSHVRDIYSRYVNKCNLERLIDTYDKSSRQLYKLALKWRNFKADNRASNLKNEHRYEYRNR